jgi:hypothetical protein
MTPALDLRLAAAGGAKGVYCVKISIDDSDNMDARNRYCEKMPAFVGSFEAASLQGQEILESDAYRSITTWDF